jgi:lysozyme family protein
MRFEDAMPFVLPWKGAFSIDLKDPGSATNLGISADLGA